MTNVFQVTEIVLAVEPIQEGSEMTMSEFKTLSNLF